MSEYRWEARVRVENGVTEWTASGLRLQLITIALLPGPGVLDERGAPVERAPVLWDLRPREARELAFQLLEFAELAERRSEALG